MSSVRQRKTVKAQSEHRKDTDEQVKDGARWGLFFKLATFVFIIFPASCLLVLVFLIESPIEPEPLTDSLPEPPQLEGPLASNDLLVVQGERLFEGQVIGPESIVHRSGHLYTGTADGKLLHIDLSTRSVETVLTLGPPPCGQIKDEQRCGRPLGMRFDKDGYLILLDAYFGMYKINVSSRDSVQMFPGSVKVEGQELRFVNDLDIAADGTIYFTDSTRFRRNEFVLDFLEGKAHGRLLKYDQARNKIEVLYKNLYFPNGVQLSEDNSYLLMSETFKVRILKYHITGPKQGQVEMFAENLPGFPDNIRRSSSGGYWVALGACRNAGRFDLVNLQHYPWLRKQLAKMPTKFIVSGFSSCCLIIELDSQGKIIRNLRDPNRERFSFISEVEDVNGSLYLGSFAAPYIGKVNTHKKPVAAG